MLYEVMLSLRLHLADRLPQLSKVQLLYDGVTLAGLGKPFVTIQTMPSPFEFVSAGRTSLRENLNFQLGVYASTYTEHMRLQAEVREVLLEAIPLYREDGTKTESTFVADVSEYTPMTNDDLANTTNNHRGYFDVSVELYRNVGKQSEIYQ